MSEVWKKASFIKLGEDYKQLLVFIRENPYALKVVGNYVMPSTYHGFSKLILKAAVDPYTKMFIMRPLIQGEFEYAAGDYTKFMREKSRLPNRVTGDFVLGEGSKYLQTLLAELITEVMNDRMTTYEVDPEKVTKGIETNRDRLATMTQRFLDRIMSPEMLEAMPRTIRALAAAVCEIAHDYGLDERILPLVGNLIILRFICPAIAIPEFYGTSPDGRIPTPRTRRNLVLISKLIQCLANGCKPGDREDYLKPLDGFYERNYSRFSSYLMSCIQDPKPPHRDDDETKEPVPWLDFHRPFTPMDASEFVIDGNFKLRELAIAHRVYAANTALIVDRIIEASRGEITHENGKYSIFVSKLNNLLQFLGKPVTIGPEPYVDPENPRVKEYLIVKVNKRGRRQDRILKFTSCSIINISRKDPTDLEKPATILNEIVVGEISDIVVENSPPTIRLMFDPSYPPIPKQPGYFPPREPPRTRPPRVYEFETARLRDEVLGEILELCFSHHSSFDPLAFQLTKVNKYGKAQTRVFKLSRDSLMNLKNQTIRSELHFHDIEFVREDRAEPTVLWLKIHSEEVSRKNICKTVEDRKALQKLIEDGIARFDS